METNSNERQKKCQQCNTSFACCIQNCWCSSFPQIMEMTENGDCFCPDCLEVIINEKIKKADSKKKLSFMSKEEMVEMEDYYYNEQGYWVFTEQYHLKRGYCCKNRCKHCPYEFKRII
jgi:hypothetical protein